MGYPIIINPDGTLLDSAYSHDDNRYATCCWLGDRLYGVQIYGVDETNSATALFLIGSVGGGFNFNHNVYFEPEIRLAEVIGPNYQFEQYLVRTSGNTLWAFAYSAEKVWKITVDGDTYDHEVLDVPSSWYDEYRPINDPNTRPEVWGQLEKDRDGDAFFGAAAVGDTALIRGASFDPNTQWAEPAYGGLLITGKINPE